jgi:hypothetical protein
MIVSVAKGGWKDITPQPGYVYNVDCDKSVDLVSSVDKPLQNAVIIANCGIKIASKGFMKNVVIGSSLAPTKVDTSTIDIGSSAVLGDSVDCSNTGNVKLLSMAGIHGAAKTQYKGIQILAKGLVHLAAQVDAKVEINVQSAGDIKFTSGNEFGEVCMLDEEDLLRVSYYRLVL